MDTGDNLLEVLNGVTSGKVGSTLSVASQKPGQALTVWPFTQIRQWTTKRKLVLNQNKAKEMLFRTKPKLENAVRQNIDRATLSSVS